MNKPSVATIVWTTGFACMNTGCFESILTCQPDPNDPFQGRWSERSSISCDDESESQGRIAEVIFCQGEFSVTRTPLETRTDYQGTYVLDPNTNALVMTVTNGNFIPDDVDLTGTVEFQTDGSIVLRDIYLGSFPEDADDQSDVACGHVLEPM